MSLLGAEYASSDEGEVINAKAHTQATATPVIAAPDVSVDVWSRYPMDIRS